MASTVAYQQSYPWAPLANQYAQFLYGPKLDYKGSQILKIKKRTIGPGPFIVL